MVKFWSNSQEEIQAEIVVMCHERLCSGPASNVVHHRSFHLQEAELVQVATNKRDYLCTDNEFLTRIRVENQIQIALAIAK